MLSLIVESAKGGCSVTELKELSEIPSDRLNKCIRLLVENEFVRPNDIVEEFITTERGVRFLNLRDEMKELAFSDRIVSSRIFMNKIKK